MWEKIEIRLWPLGNKFELKYKCYLYEMYCRLKKLNYLLQNRGNGIRIFVIKKFSYSIILRIHNTFSFISGKVTDIDSMYLSVKRSHAWDALMEVCKDFKRKYRLHSENTAMKYWHIWRFSHIIVYYDELIHCIWREHDAYQCRRI